MISIICFIGAVNVVTVLGTPTFLLLRPFAPGKWWMALAAGLVLGIPLCLIIPGRPTLIVISIVMSLTGLSALVFWLVWRWAAERKDGWCRADPRRAR